MTVYRPNSVSDHLHQSTSKTDDVTASVNVRVRTSVSIRLLNPASLPTYAANRLGSGSSGQVTQIRSLHSGNIYALKVVMDNGDKLWKDPMHPVRKEVDVMKKLHHVSTNLVISLLVSYHS